MAESEELKSLLMRVKEESEKTGLKLPHPGTGLTSPLSPALAGGHSLAPPVVNDGLSD